MSNENESSSLALSFAIFAAAGAVFIGAQIGAVNRGTSTIKWQLANADKQLQNLADAKKQFADLIVKRDELVKQSGEIQKNYTNLLNDVLDLAKDDKDAQAVVQKYGIQRQTPPADAKSDAKPEEKKPDAK